MPRRTKRLSVSGNCLLSADNEEEERDDQDMVVEEEKPVRNVRRSLARRSLTRRRSTTVDLHISQIYADCIQMGTKNKINQQNAWKAKLVDVMDKILAQDVKEMQKKAKETENSPATCNFQLATNTLDTSVKIYSYRVDSVHNDTYKVLNGLNRSTKQNTPTVSAGEEDSVESSKSKKRKIVSIANTLETASSLNNKRLDMEFSVDPLFHKTAAAFDEGGAKGLLLSQLGISNGCNIVFDSTEYHIDKIVISNEGYDSSTLMQFVTGSWTDTTVCPFFEDFSFNMDKSIDSTPELPSIDMQDQDMGYEDYSSSFEYLSQSQLEFQSYDDSPTPYDTNESSQNDTQDILASQMSDMSLEPPSDIESSPCYTDTYDEPDDTITHLLEGSSSIPSVDSIKNLVIDGSDYNYFSNTTSTLTRNWAGPEHWKFKQTKNQALRDGDEEKEKATRTKKVKREFFIDFFEEDETDYETLFKHSKRGGTISKEALLNSTKPTTLPFVDIHYDVKRFTELFSKPGQSISFQKERTGDQVEGQNQSFGEGDTMMFAEADVPLQMDTYDDHEDAEFGGFADAPNWEDSQANSQEPSFSSQLEGLVDAPESVNDIKITYARRAKRVDIDKLKTSIWTELCRTKEEIEENTSNEVTEIKAFSEVLTTLPNSVPQSQMADLSVPLCFICLLDLANKKGLQIDQLDGDLKIQKYIKA